ncbi:glycosyltransferase [Nocardioides sp. zg-DK7169]|uniref:glycosyltransferase n=1 Tax=Nocardioides sp. zg-DK7169 TaxID=2736600 RepID=UPI001557F5AB|nr:glycosyltransferase [Nocardioides sp. zg-DK7169]NPC98985.1 glycosyl transferase [Nocardioides sp. zg-DK7169]
MIGYYVHHQGRGHLHRALAVQEALGEPVTVLSSLEPPPDQRVGWVRLERDDLGVEPGDEGGRESRDVTARGRLHWVPRGDTGLAARMQQVSAWLVAARPRLLVADVSVEVALLARLHGVPVVGVVLPGRRDDAAHLLGFDVADRLVGMWPPEVTPAMLPGLPAPVVRRVHAVGALSRRPVVEPGTRRPGPPRVVVLGGAGGSQISEAALAEAMRSAPGWEWRVCGPPGPWVEDPHALVRDADVVITHAGQNAVAEVAAARRPAVLVPQERPHEEQRVSAAAIRAGGWPVLVEQDLPTTGWAERLTRAAALDGTRWATWCDGAAAQRFAAVLAPERAGEPVEVPA